jgi:opacity protein-like surface antigen
MMTMRTGLSCAAAALALAAPQAALAQEDMGHFYLQGFGGANWANDFEFNADFLAGGENAGEYEFETGYGVGGAAGYDFGSVRIEGEVAFRDNGRISSDGEPTGDDLTALTLMANAYYDFENSSPVTPYVGGGLGTGRVEYNSPAEGLFAEFGASDWGFAAQGILGVTYEVTDTMDLFAEGRALGIFGLDMSDTSIVMGQPFADVTFDNEYVSYGAFAGVRINFGVPQLQ